MQATSGPEVARVAARRRAIPNGGWGLILLICTESSLIGCLIASYFYLRFKTSVWPPPGIAKPELLTPLVLMGVLALTSIPLFLASRAALSGRGRSAAWWIVLGLVVQSGYIAMQMVQFLSDLDKFTPDSAGAYGSAYYVLLGADHFHVYAGILFSLGMLVRLAYGLTNYRANGVRVLAWYWHFVNLVTIFITFTLLTPSL